MAMTKKQLKAITKLFPSAAGAPTHDLVVERGGTATTRDVVIEGKVRLNWKADGTSFPVPLPAGTYRLFFFVRGKDKQTFAFRLVSPHQENLGVGKLGPMGVEAYDRNVVIP